MDRELFQTLAFDLSLGARLSLARMVGTEPLVRSMRLLEWGLLIKGRGFPLILSIRIDSSGHWKRKFSTLLKLREGLGLPANNRSI